MKKRPLFTLLAGVTGGFGLAVPSALALTPAEVADIEYIRQEEKVARDVYDQLYSTWGVRIFSNIAQSERNHIAAMENIMATYGMADTTPAEPGLFSIAELQALYDELLGKGNRSMVDALLVGVLVEETDIADLTRSIELSNQEDVRAVYENLRKGSENHLAAFLNQLAPLYERLESPVLNVDFDAAGLPVLSWSPSNPDASGVLVNRKNFGSDQWEVVSELSGATVEWKDEAGAGVKAKTYRITVFSSFEEVDSDFVTVLRPFDSYEDWVVAAGVPENLRLTHVDADKDGTVNLFEYLSGRDPLVSDLDPAESVSLNGGLRYSHSLRASTGDIAIGYESSPDFREWSMVPQLAIEHRQIGTGIVEVRVSIPNNSRASYLRTVAETR